MLTIIFASTPVNSFGKTTCSGTFEKSLWSLLLNQWTLKRFNGLITSLSIVFNFFVISLLIEWGLQSSEIFGKIIPFFLKYSEVLLLTDVSHYMPIKSITNDFFCNARGSGRSQIIICKYNPLVDTQKITVGHIFYTSGLGGIYPKDIEIGQVDRAIQIDPTTVELEIKLYANPIASDLLGVIKY